MNSGLVNLIATIEQRLTGTSASTPLDSTISALLPDADTYVVALFDGLGSHQLDHPRASELKQASRHDLVAPFPTTTTVAMSTIATGTAPITHGTIGHQMWIPQLDGVANVLKWRRPSGEQLTMDTTDWLPSPNLWERLRMAGVEPITVQPGDFSTSPLTRALYRGARFEAVYTDQERIDATVQLASVPKRLIFVYFAEVDFAAHVSGQASTAYSQAISGAGYAWSELDRKMPQGAALVGTADHGHVDFAESSKQLIRDAAYRELTFFGDPRALYVNGPADVVAALALETRAERVDHAKIVDMLGEGPRHHELGARLPNALLLAGPASLLIPPGMDRRLIGYHGGDTTPERAIPLLVGGGR